MQTRLKTSQTLFPQKCSQFKQIIIQKRNVFPILLISNDFQQ